MITVKPKLSTTALIYAKVDKKSDLDIITSTFNCFNNEAVTDECILDLTMIEEDDTLRVNELKEVFGEKIAEDFIGALIVFHA